MWASVVSGLPPRTGVALDIEHFADIEPEIRDAVAAITETGPADFGLRWHVVIDGRDVTAVITALGDAEAALVVAEQARESARRNALETLAKAGLSQGAIGDVLGVSHQRVHQLLRAG